MRRSRMRLRRVRTRNRKSRRPPVWRAHTRNLLDHSVWTDTTGGAVGSGVTFAELRRADRVPWWKRFLWVISGWLKNPLDKVREVW